MRKTKTATTLTYRKNNNILQNKANKSQIFTKRMYNNNMNNKT